MSIPEMMLLGCCLAALLACAPPARLTLVEDGLAKATIVLASKPTKAAQLGALELQWHVRQMSGAELPIVHEGEGPAVGVQILVGESDAAKSLGYSADALKPQEYVIAAQGETLVLLGRDKADYGQVDYAIQDPINAPNTLPDFFDAQATLYAVYDLLEDMGVRWLTPMETGTFIPHKRTLTVDCGTLKRTPGFPTRNAEPYWGPYEALVLWKSDTPEFAQLEATAYSRLHKRFPDEARYLSARRFVNYLYLIRQRIGGKLSYANHSLYRYYDIYWEKNPNCPNLFVEQRPQYFAKGYVGRPPQMCYTNKDFIALLAHDAGDYFDKGGYPAGSGPGPGYVWGEDSFTIEPMDDVFFCRCPECQKFPHTDYDHRGVFSNGRDSDYFFSFVNAVAREVKKTHPDKAINTLAYMSHAWPPKSFTLESNVAVHFCFAGNRAPWCIREFDDEEAAYRAWRKDKNRAIYVWLYDTFPLEYANGRGHKCFPGATAHTIDRYMKQFAKDGVRGFFFCGFGQEVEGYVNLQLMFHPEKDIETILDDYFNGMFGAAAKPMKEFYSEIERTYSDPKNYPEDIATGKVISHQTQEIAWGYLGRENRMAKLAALIDEAKALARTEREKTNVAQYELSTWKYMQRGRQEYMDLVKSSYAGIKRTVRAVISPDPAGDPQKVDWEDATVLDPFRFPIGEPTERPVAAKLAHDDRNLYVALEQRGDARALAEPDAWQLLLAPQEGKPYRQVQVAVKGHQAVVECNDVSETGTKPSEIAVTAAVDRKPDSITIYLALPLKDLAPGGVQPGGDIYANIIRCTKGSDQPMWMPTFGEPDVASHLGYLVLERLRNPQSFTQTVDPAQLRQGLVGEWLMDETSGEVVKDSSGNGLDGKVFNSAEWGPGKVNGGFICEDSQFADFGNDPKTRLTTSVTIAAWINPSRWSDWCPTVMAKGYENGGYSLHIRSDWSLWFELDDAEGKRHYYNPTEITLTQKAWSHVAASYDGQTMRVYINGHEVGDGLPCSITIKDTPQPLRVCYSWGLGYFVGIMDEVRLYNRALSQPEILGLYRMGKGG